MADGGWIKDFRKSVGSLPWSSGDLFKLWHLCLYKASFDDRDITFNGMTVSLNRGQFVTGRTAMRDKMNEGVKPAQQVNSSFVWRGLKKFEKAGMLNISSNPKYSVITIVNWDKYQESEQLPNSYRTATEQQTDTNKNYKNDKKKTPSSDALLDRFNALWKLYPKKLGKQNSFKAYKKAIKDGATDDQIKTGIEAYIKYLTKEQTDPQYIKQGSSFFNQRSWEDDWSGGGISPEPQESKPLDKVAALLHEIEDEMSLHPTVSRQEAAEITARMFTENGRTTTADKILKFLDKYERKKSGNEQ
jgi:hypothetical protein